jgi:MraZ protein
VAGAERIGIDTNGRILIPRRYLDSAEIGSEVRFIGMDNSIELWNREKAEQLLYNPEELAENLELLMRQDHHEQ